MKHTIKQLNLGKNSFTLFETLLSITILSIVISGFTYSTYYDEEISDNYQKLNSLENQFNTNDYKNFTSSTQTIKITINHDEYKDLNVKIYTYEDETIRLIKYEK